MGYGVRSPNSSISTWRAENYQKAGDTLERMLDVDPYGQGHFDRLENLEGHIDAVWYKNIFAVCSRLPLARTPTR